MTRQHFARAARRRMAKGKTMISAAALWLRKLSTWPGVSVGLLAVVGLLAWSVDDMAIYPLSGFLGIQRREGRVWKVEYYEELMKGQTFSRWVSFYGSIPGGSIPSSAPGFAVALSPPKTSRSSTKRNQ
jgi:hypothetical protein